MAFEVIDANGALKVIPTGLVVASGKVLTASNSLTLAGTDGSTLNVGTGGTLGTAAYTAASAYASLVSKSDTGDPAGSEGLICINTFDNTVKIYADGAWRTLASGW